uniref:Patatin n=1 Tax=Tetraselmis chuii TaxID=63592 RepID=A0A7S1SRS5_9CHLO|mmetsp:Transcript_24562/g.43737  ORF Transcript_24562/g.43737 Transcript_24562/m.43737 type:complete len:335 (+) Transcript_24562:1-1005(+)
MTPAAGREAPLPPPDPIVCHVRLGAMLLALGARATLRVESRISLRRTTALAPGAVAPPRPLPQHGTARGASSPVVREAPRLGRVGPLWVAGKRAVVLWRLPAMQRADDSSTATGVSKFLATRYDLSRVEMMGTSCGALCATLTACGVNPERTLRSAYDLSLEANLWDRPLGLAGIWGGLILRWLEELLPDNAGDMCRERVRIMITEVPNLRQTAVDDYLDKEDLIRVNMASVHVPIFLDWKLTAACRERQCVDGSIPDVVFRRSTSASIDDMFADERCIVIDHKMDEQLKLEQFGFLKLREYSEVQYMMELGYRFAERLQQNGTFDALPSLSRS